MRGWCTFLSAGVRGTRACPRATLVRACPGRLRALRVSQHGAAGRSAGRSGARNESWWRVAGRAEAAMDADEPEEAVIGLLLALRTAEAAPLRPVRAQSPAAN